MCAIYRPLLKNGMLKVSQIQLSHVVAVPISMGDCAQVVPEVGKMVLLLFLYVVKRSYFFFLQCNEREQTGAFRLITGRGRGVERRGKEIMVLNKVKSLNFHISFPVYHFL